MPRRNARQETMGVPRLECGQIQKSGDPVHVEQMCLTWMAREADGNDRQVGDDRVMLPIRQRHGGEQVVIADHRIGFEPSNELERLRQAHARKTIEAEVLEETTEVFAEKRVTPDTQHSHAENILPGRPEVQRPERTNGS